MAMSIATLSSGLESMTPVDNESDAIDNLSSAFEDYFYESSVSGISPQAGALASSISSMKSSFSGLSNDAAAAIQAGIIAFWTSAIASAATIWLTFPFIISATPPPSLSTIAATLNSTFSANLAAELSLPDAANAVATALHPLQLGGIATLSPPPPGGTPTPIL